MNIQMMMFSALMLLVDAKKGSGGSGNSGTSTSDDSHTKSAAAIAAAAAELKEKKLQESGLNTGKHLTVGQEAENFYYNHKAEMIVAVSVLLMFFFVKFLMKRMKYRDDNFRKQ